MVNSGWESDFRVDRDDVDMVPWAGKGGEKKLYWEAMKGIYDSTKITLKRVPGLISNSGDLIFSLIWQLCRFVRR